MNELVSLQMFRFNVDENLNNWGRNYWGERK